MKELKDKRVYFHWGKSYLLNEALALNDSVSDLLRERNELLAQVERLRGAANGLIADCEEALFNDESVFCVNHDVVSDLEEVLDETQSQSLEVVKREIAGDAINKFLGCIDVEMQYNEKITDCIPKALHRYKKEEQ